MPRRARSQGKIKKTPDIKEFKKARKLKGLDKMRKAQGLVQTGEFKIDLSSVEKTKRAIESVSKGHVARVMREGGPFRGLRNKIAGLKNRAARKMGITPDTLKKMLDSGSRSTVILAPKVNPVKLRRRRAQDKNKS